VLRVSVMNAERWNRLERGCGRHAYQGKRLWAEGGTAAAEADGRSIADVTPV
jgi:hypothetical protein